MKKQSATPRRVFRFVPFAFCFALCLLVSCHRGPRNAVELFNQMPRRFGGELHVQGESHPRTLNVEVLDLQARDAHLLEFKRIAYEVSGGDEGTLKGEAPVKGTISAPGGEIHIEDTGGAGGGDALKTGSFEGKLGSDLTTVDAKWKTGFDQSVHFEGKAAR